MPLKVGTEAKRRASREAMRRWRARQRAEREKGEMSTDGIKALFHPPLPDGDGLTVTVSGLEVTVEMRGITRAIAYMRGDKSRWVRWDESGTKTVPVPGVYHVGGIPDGHKTVRGFTKWFEVKDD